MLGLRSMRVAARPPRRPRLRLLVHKPTFACTARCAACEPRRRLHRDSRVRPQVTFAQCEQLYRQAAELGVRELHLSGGEPTLYPQLAELVALGKRLGWYVMVNTNGSQFGREGLVKRLFDAGLDGVMLSLYSHQAAVHDRLRGQPGLFQRALQALERCVRHRREGHDGFLVVTQSILARHNLLDAADLVRLVGDAGADVHLFSYVEGDFDVQHVPSAALIEQFRRHVLPRLRRQILAQRGANPLVRAVGVWQAGRLFGHPGTRVSDYAAGIYQPDLAASRRCSIPETFLLLLADGDVHPCNMVEYSHGPVVGNVLDNGLDLRSIWQGSSLERFRKDRHPRCRQCPMTQHVWIPLHLTLGRAGLFLRGRL
jgi:pyrroloquinoline quinone biosynthesis protein E